MRARLVVLPLAVALAIVAAPRRSLAQEPESQEIVEARRQFLLGVEAQDAGRYREALASYKASPIRSPSLVFNVATCHERLGELLAAEAAFAEALEVAETRKVEEVAWESRAKLTALREQIPRVTIRIPPEVIVDDTLKLLVDDRPVAIENSSFELRLDPGSHRLVVRSERQVGVFSVALDLPLRSTRVIDVDLGPERTEPETKTVVIERDGPKKSYTPALIAGGGALALGAAALVTGIIGHDQRARYHELNGTPTLENAGERENLRSEGQMYFVANAVFIGLATAATGIAVYFFVRPPITSNPRRSSWSTMDLLRGQVAF